MCGGQVCIVKMTGAKSGARLELPLTYVPYGNKVVLVASLAGAPRHPTWYYKLVKQPRIEVTVGNQTKNLTVRIASAAEKATVWPLCCKEYPDFALYQRRTERYIPMFICE